MIHILSRVKILPHFSPHLKASLPKNFKSFLGKRPSFYFSNDTPEILDEHMEEMNEKENGKKAQYKFSEKSMVLPVNMPLFPFSTMLIRLGDFKFKIYSKETPLFFTTVLKKENGNGNKEIKENSGENELNNFYNVGTYCSAEIDPSLPNTLILEGIHRVEILDIEKNPISVEEQAEAMEELKIDEPLPEDVIHHEEEHPVQPPKDGKFKKKVLSSEVKKLLKSQLNPKSLVVDEPYLYFATVKRIDDPEFQLDLAVETKLKHLIDIYSKILYLNKGQIPLVNYNLGDAYRLLDSLGGILCSTNYFKAPEMQEALQKIELSERLEIIHSLTAKHLVFLQNFSDIGQLAQQNIKQKKAQEFYEEVFKIVKGVVEGEKGKNGVIAKLKKTLEGKKPPAHVVKIFEEEVKKFTSIDEMSSESNIIRTYLDWLVSLPYGIESKDTFDIEYAKKILDEDHYGMEEIKDRILEFIAVGQLKGSLKGKIICLIGPPGVGKTSLAASIAKALNRKYARVAMGGESDSAFLKGHRKTYIGAYPGKIIQALKECETENCVILLDEIDKLGKSEIHGDPQSNLLEILDPAQNNTFTDNYLDFPVDLSKVLFICSANISDTISPPLLDRMDVIQLSSYTGEEKKQIYYRHLLPKLIKETGISQEYFLIPQTIVDVLVSDYCREPGVRTLEKYTKKIIEKIAYQLVRDSSIQKIEIDETLLIKYIGQPKYMHSRFYKETPIGVVTGLAYTEYGGCLIYIEAMQSSFSSSPAPSGLKITGSLGSVMKESMQIAYSYAKSFSSQTLSNRFLEQNEVHLHAPEGATPKDGPSAGITITTAILSLVMKQQVKHNIAMTGEISLRGKILKIGGVKEKVLAAKREKIFELVLPKGNEEDVRELKEYVKEGIKFHFVENYQEAFGILFPEWKGK